MYASRAEITVAELGPAKLMNRLATHWAHKFDVELDESSASIPLPGAQCHLQADGARLIATIEAEDPETLERIQGAVADHLLRMARGEALAIDWKRVPGPPA
jgi:hypothetical protein